MERPVGHVSSCDCMQCRVGRVVAPEPASAPELRISYETALDALQELAREAGMTAHRDTSSGHDRALVRARKLLQAAGRIR